MHAGHIPRWSTGAGAAGHAHPSPADAATPVDSEPCLEDIAARLPIHVKLEGLAATGHMNAQNTYQPRVRRSSSCNQVIEHIDVVTCWKGLSYSQASELAFWERSFRDCLGSQVEHALRLVIAEQLGTLPRSTDGLSLLIDLNERLAGLGSQVVDIDSTSIVHDMMSAYYNEEPFHAGRSFRWGAGSGNLPRFLRNLIRSQDCFLHDVEGSKVLVEKISYNYVSPVFNITADIAWVPPNVRFDGVPALVKPQEVYCVAPVYAEPHPLFDHPTFEPYPDRFHFTVTQSTSSAEWDSVKGCFRLVAPFNKVDLGAQNSVSDLSVTVFTLFPGEVSLERTSRYRITITVQSTVSGVNATSESPLQPQGLPSLATKVGSLSGSGGRFSKPSQSGRDGTVKDTHDHFAHNLDSTTTMVDFSPEPAPAAGSPDRKRKAQPQEPSTNLSTVYSFVVHPSYKMVSRSDLEKRRRIQCEHEMEGDPRLPPWMRSCSLYDQYLFLQSLYGYQPGSGRSSKLPSKWACGCPYVASSMPGNLSQSAHLAQTGSRAPSAESSRAAQTSRDPQTIDVSNEHHLSECNEARRFIKTAYQSYLKSRSVPDTLDAKKDFSAALLCSESDKGALGVYEAANGMRHSFDAGVIAAALRYDPSIDDFAMNTSERTAIGFPMFDGVQIPHRSAFSASETATVGDASSQGTTSTGSAISEQNTAHDDTAGSDNVPRTVRERVDSMSPEQHGSLQRRDSVFSEQRHLNTPAAGTEPSQEQIQQTYAEFEKEAKAKAKAMEPQRHEDFIDDFTEPEISDDFTDPEVSDGDADDDDDVDRDD